MFLSIVPFSQVSGQSDSTSHNWIVELGFSFRIPLIKDNNLSKNNISGLYHLEIGHEWNVRAKNKLGFLFSGQIMQEGAAFLTPMMSWRHQPSQDLGHRFAAGPILLKSRNDEDLFNGFSVSYDLEFYDKIAITNRIDLIKDSTTDMRLSYSPGIEFRGKYAKVVIIGGTIVTGVAVIVVLQAIGRSR